MIRLQLLGAPHLARADGPDASNLLAQPKRFALLAYLAVGAGTYYRRDLLLAMFWLELDQFAARRALRNTLYQLRLALGDDVFVSRGDDEIMLDRANLWCDVHALRDAVTAGQYDAAVDLYRGEFLDGFHISNSGEGFEDWLTPRTHRDPRTGPPRLPRRRRRHPAQRPPRRRRPPCPPRRGARALRRSLDPPRNRRPRRQRRPQRRPPPLRHVHPTPRDRAGNQTQRRDPRPHRPRPLRQRRTRRTTTPSHRRRAEATL